MGHAQQCPTGSGIGMIVARASTEAPGTGIIGGVADDVASQIPGSTITSVDYPATLQNYQSSEAQGVAAMTQLVRNFTTNCPGAKMVLMGYSQGAQVTMDVLLAAVVLMGDPSYTPDQTFNAGTATNAGRFPRQDVAACGAVTSRIASFCNTDDTFCDSGNNLQVHLSYIQTNGPDASKFIISKVKTNQTAA
ncbi:cutinase [Truncatella angustata]|uniref:Cutinase n=1 Tax=Truncatella angustata TaxID=152316 RepID=A0A9P8UPT7_9PEZI|nr:cutinase [Truncatella angustata]KAH6656132.1 cutinase [Truncatella angustata]